MARIPAGRLKSVSGAAKKVATGIQLILEHAESLESTAVRVALTCLSQGQPTFLRLARDRPAGQPSVTVGASNNYRMHRR